MLVQYVIVCSLLASPVLSSAVKGYADSGIKGGQRVLPIERHREAARSAPSAQQQESQWAQHQVSVKTAAVGTEQRREPASIKGGERQWEQVAVKGSGARLHEQQREEIHQAAVEEQREHREQAREELPVQRREEAYSAKGASNEARPQVRLEEAKGGARHEEAKGRIEETKGAHREVQTLTQQREEQPITKSIRSEDAGLKAEQQERLERLERERLERERLERERLERERLERERLERERLERERLERERLELQRVEQERLGQQKLEQQRLESERLEQQRDDQQAVELNRGDSYEQSRLNEEQQHLQQSQIAIVQRDESSIKGGAAFKGQRQEQSLVAEPEPYAFDYSIEGSTRRESGDTKGVVRGQYTLQGADGSSRVVDYIADHNGFRATVNTNEFGTETRSGAGFEIRSSQPSAEEITQRISGTSTGKVSIKAAESVPRRPDNWSVKQVPLALSTPAKGQQRAIEPIQQQQRLESEKDLTPAVQQTKLEAERDLAAPAVQQQQQLQIAETSLALEQPTKSELRAPKALSGELKRSQEEEIGQLRGGSFESATAHHNVVHPPQVGGVRSVVKPVTAAAPAPLPVAPVHHRQYLRPARHQYDRQPVVHQIGRANQEQQSPRLSFYGANSNTEPIAEDSAASFAE